MRRDRAQLALIAVAVLHALSPLLVRGAHAAFGWDETVYLSQINAYVPAGLFSAPRARGLTLLVAPVSLVTNSLVAMRVWLAALSGLGLWLAFRPWQRIIGGYVVPLAALVFSTLWVSIYYGFEAMPNEYSAFAAVAATGWVFLALREQGHKRPWIWVGAAVAFAALIRPSDALCLVVGLLLVTIGVRRVTWRRRGLSVAVILVGFVAGTAEWVIEAYIRFGGPIARLRAASAVNTGGVHWSLATEWHALAGPILCRSGCTVRAPLHDQIWWPVLGGLVVAGLLVGRRRKHLTAISAAVVVGVVIGAEYVIGIAYAAPRFLLPAYAMLSIPAAETVLWLVARRPRWSIVRPIAIAGAVCAIGAQAVSQVSIARSLSDQASVYSAQQEQVSDFLSAHGIASPCDIAGHASAPIAYLTDCRDLSRSTSADHEAQTDHEVVAFVGRPPAAVRRAPSDWTKYVVDQPDSPPWQVWLPGHSQQPRRLHHRRRHRLPA